VVAAPSLRRLPRAAPLLALLAAACGSGEQAADEAAPPAASADPSAASADSPAQVTPPKPDPQVTPAHLERASLRVLGMS
jgi:hypothetical protein